MEARALAVCVPGRCRSLLRNADLSACQDRKSVVVIRIAPEAQDAPRISCISFLSGRYQYDPVDCRRPVDGALSVVCSITSATIFNASSAAKYSAHPPTSTRTARADGTRTQRRRLGFELLAPARFGQCLGRPPGSASALLWNPSSTVSPRASGNHAAPDEGTGAETASKQTIRSNFGAIRIPIQGTPESAAAPHAIVSLVTSFTNSGYAPRPSRRASRLREARFGGRRKSALLRMRRYAPSSG